MEDYVLREIDRIGEMLLKIARRLGLLDDGLQDYSFADVQEEFEQAGLPMDWDTLFQQEHPIAYLVETVKLSDQGLETWMDILFHSDLDESKKSALLDDALNYLDAKGFYSFKLHSLQSVSKNTAATRI